MKKNVLELVAVIALVIPLSFSACKKSNDITASSIRNTEVKSTAPGQLSTSGPSLITNATKPVLYSTCNRQVKVFTPLATTYQLAMESGESGLNAWPFGIATIGDLDFNHVDDVTFEFSGVYADVNKTVKLYRIKRTDGKYLTFQIAAAYMGRFDGDLAKYQLWLVSDLGDNKYNLMLPKMYTCYLLRTYYDNVSGGYRAGFIVSSETTYPGSTTISLNPNLSKTPAIQ